VKSKLCAISRIFFTDFGFLKAMIKNKYKKYTMPALTQGKRVMMVVKKFLSNSNWWSAFRVKIQAPKNRQ